MSTPSHPTARLSPRGISWKRSETGPDKQPSSGVRLLLNGASCAGCPLALSGFLWRLCCEHVWRKRPCGKGQTPSAFPRCREAPVTGKLQRRASPLSTHGWKTAPPDSPGHSASRMFLQALLLERSASQGWKDTVHPQRAFIVPSQNLISLCPVTEPAPEGHPSSLLVYSGGYWEQASAADCTCKLSAMNLKLSPGKVRLRLQPRLRQSSDFSLLAFEVGLGVCHIITVVKGFDREK